MAATQSASRTWSKSQLAGNHRVESHILLPICIEQSCFQSLISPVVLTTSRGYKTRLLYSMLCCYICKGWHVLSATAVCLQSDATVADKDASLCQSSQHSSHYMLRSISFCIYHVATAWCKTAVSNQEQTSLSLPSQSTAT